MRNALVHAYGIAVAPKRAPDLARGAVLYIEDCAACHGSAGRSDGLMATQLEPKPSNFHVRERQDQRSVYGLYSTVGLGLPGTGMTAYSQLSDSDRWVLAFYVSRFNASDAGRQRGAGLRQAGQRGTMPDLRTLTTLTPAAARNRGGDEGVALLALLRAEPMRLDASAAGTSQTPIAFSRCVLATSAQTYRSGNSVQRRSKQSRLTWRVSSWSSPASPRVRQI